MRRIYSWLVLKDEGRGGNKSYILSATADRLPSRRDLIAWEYIQSTVTSTLTTSFNYGDQHKFTVIVVANSQLKYELTCKFILGNFDIINSYNI